MRAVSRRTVLEGAFGAAALAALRPAAATTAPIASELMLVSGFGGNVVALTTSDGLVLVDSGAPIARKGPLLPILEQLPAGLRVHTLFNTHWHLDQVGGNEWIGNSGATIVAHEKTRLHLATPTYDPVEDRYRPPLPVKAQPNESFYTTAEKTIGGRRIDYGYLLEAHTDGDAYVYFRDANVIAVGDAIAPHRDVELDWFGGGWLGGRVDSLQQLLKITDARTRFVPSYGDPVGRDAVQAEHDTCKLLFDRFFERVRKGETPEYMLANGIMESTGRTWNDAAKFVHDANKGFWGHNNTLSHDIV